jgi:glycine betaine/choline ABC-type transport system substrate-binding protein
MDEALRIAKWLQSEAQTMAQRKDLAPADMQQVAAFAKTAAVLLRGRDDGSAEELEELIAAMESGPASRETIAANADVTRAESLYTLSVELNKRIQRNDLEAARQLIEVAADAIKAYGGTDYERTVELRKFLEQANEVLPPASFKDVLDRIQRTILIILYPTNRAYRRIFYAVASVITILIAFLSVRDKLPALTITWSQPIRVGAMDFEEQGILGEIIAQYLERRNIHVIRVFDQPQTTLEKGIEDGYVDCYVEYSGAPYYLKFHKDKPALAEEVYNFDKDRYAKVGVSLSAPFPFENEWAIWIRSDDSERWNVRTLSELARLSTEQSIRAGWPPDFVHDPKGGAAEMLAHYQMHVRQRELDISEVYKALKDRTVDAIVGNSTDAEALQGWLTQVADDRRFFPPYQPIIFARNAALQSHKELGQLLKSLPDKFSLTDMRRLNLQAQGSMNRSQIAHSWLDAHGL